MEINGKPVFMKNPQDSLKAGIGVIHQEFNLVPSLTASGSIFLGQEPDRFSFIPHSEERQKARQLFQRIGVEVDPQSCCGDLSAEQQVVEIASLVSKCTDFGDGRTNSRSYSAGS